MDIYLLFHNPAILHSTPINSFTHLVMQDLVLDPVGRGCLRDLQHGLPQVGYVKPVEGDPPGEGGVHLVLLEAQAGVARVEVIDF